VVVDAYADGLSFVDGRLAWSRENDDTGTVTMSASATELAPVELGIAGYPPPAAVADSVFFGTAAGPAVWSLDSAVAYPVDGIDKVEHISARDGCFASEGRDQDNAGSYVVGRVPLDSVTIPAH